MTTIGQTLSAPRRIVLPTLLRSVSNARLVESGSLFIVLTAILVLVCLAPLGATACRSEKPGRLGGRQTVHAALVWVLLAGGLVSCGGSGTGAVGNSGTPTGISTLTVPVTVIAGSGERKQDITLTLTVLPTTH